MKKLLLSILTLTTVFAFAQKNISIALTTPGPYTAVVSGVALSASGTITNIGAALTSADTITVFMYVNGSRMTYTSNGTTYYWAAMIPHGAIATNGTLPFTITPALTFNISTFFGATMCAKTYLFQNGALEDVDTNNNISCNPITFSVNSGTSNISNISQSVKVYPNPARDIVNFSIDGSIAKTITVLDITGRTIEVIKINTSDTQINIGEYNNGIYLYQIKSETDELIKSGKFNVSK
ncbi:MAG: T9SS type A sorting domain-containing protein [Bacteroidota bacterium]